MSQPRTAPGVVTSDVQRKLDFMHGALGAAGHSITDPVSLELLERYARGEISGDECRAALIDHTLHS